MNENRIEEPWTDELPGWQLQQRGDTLCHAYDFEDTYEAFDFVILLCQIAKERQQKPCFRVRDGHVFVQCAVPEDGATDDLRRFARDLNDLREGLT